MEAYKCVIGDNGGQTYETTVALKYVDSDVMTVQVGFMGNTVHLDLTHAIELRDAIDAAIMLMTLPAGFYPAVNVAPPF